MTETEQTIIRTPHGAERPYVATCRASAQDRRLSWEARGVLWYLLSKPDDWKVKTRDLEQNCGRDKARNIIKELIAFGYLERVQQENGPGGKFTDVEYRVHETPVTEKPSTAQPSTAKPTLHNKDEHTTEEHKKDSASAAGEAPAPSKKKPDPEKRQLHKHPAVQAYREIAHRFPAHSWYQDIIDTVGEDTEKWRGIVKDWIGRGYNPTNVKDMLEVFRSGWSPSAKNGNGNTPTAAPGTIPKGMEKHNRTDIKDANAEWTQIVMEAARKAKREAAEKQATEQAARKEREREPHQEAA